MAGGREVSTFRYWAGRSPSTPCLPILVPMTNNPKYTLRRDVRKGRLHQGGIEGRLPLPKAVLPFPPEILRHAYGRSPPLLSCPLGMRGRLQWRE